MLSVGEEKGKLEWESIAKVHSTSFSTYYNPWIHPWFHVYSLGQDNICRCACHGVICAPDGDGWGQGLWSWMCAIPQSMWAGIGKPGDEDDDDDDDDNDGDNDDDNDDDNDNYDDGDEDD